LRVIVWGLLYAALVVAVVLLGQGGLAFVYQGF